jgi:hypothetical protein
LKRELASVAPIEKQTATASSSACAVFIQKMNDLDWAAKEIFPEGGGGFNPRKKPGNSMWALAPEGCFSGAA